MRPVPAARAPVAGPAGDPGLQARDRRKAGEFLRALRSNPRVRVSAPLCLQAVGQGTAPGLQLRPPTWLVSTNLFSCGGKRNARLGAEDQKMQQDKKWDRQARRRATPTQLTASLLFRSFRLRLSSCCVPRALASLEGRRRSPPRGCPRRPGRRSAALTRAPQTPLHADPGQAALGPFQPDVQVRPRSRGERGSSLAHALLRPSPQDPLLPSKPAEPQ